MRGFTVQRFPKIVPFCVAILWGSGNIPCAILKQLDRVGFNFEFEMLFESV